MLTVPSEWCLAATIAIADLPEKKRRETMLYRFEEKLPLTVEELAVDFSTVEDRALGVAVEAQRLSELVGELESRGVVIEWVVPRALLAFSELPFGEESPEVVVWQEEEGIRGVFSKRGASRDLAAPGRRRRPKNIAFDAERWNGAPSGARRRRRFAEAAHSFS